MTRLPLPLLIAALVGGSALAQAPAAAAQTAKGELTVTFQGIKTPTGAILMVLVAGEDGYADKAPAVDQAMIPVTGASVSTQFRNLAPGRYAVKAFHDVDGDGKMGANPFGVPTEPFAFSNNAHGAMGPPAWADAAFAVSAGANAQTIDID